MSLFVRSLFLFPTAARGAEPMWTVDSVELIAP